MPDAAPPAADRVLGRRYRLVRRIDRGGMAEVWEARDDVLARPVAVKVLHPHLGTDRGFVERFRREAIAAAALNHPNIVATFDAGSDEGLAYIVMELVPGTTLRRVLELRHCLSLPHVVAVAAQIADALDHAHRAGLVHRDVKPANILLCDDGTGTLGRVKVADFGIAKATAVAGTDLTQTGAVIGTAKYLAPEQVEGGEPDRRSDVYSLGVVLYEMICGRPPFSADTELATALQHLRAVPEPPRQLRADLPLSLEGVVLKAMTRNPDDRYQSAVELRAALLSVDVSPSDVTAVVPVPPGGERPDRQTRSRRRRLLPGLVLLLASVAALAVAATAIRHDTAGGDRSTLSGRSRTGTEVEIVAARTFDPDGSDHQENEARVGRLHDGDPDSTWATDRYSNRSFGNLKAGVGVVVQLDRPRRLDRLRVSSPTTGWAVRVFVAGRAAPELESWGTAAATSDVMSGDNDLDLGGAEGSYLLLWITRLGEGGRVEIGEIRLTS